MITMEPEEAYAYAAQWGSCMRDGDPGACMYGFNADCRPQNSKHRGNCIKWMLKCRMQVEHTMAEYKKAGYEAEEHDYSDDELEKIDAWIAYIKTAEVLEASEDGEEYRRFCDHLDGSLEIATDDTPSQWPDTEEFRPPADIETGFRPPMPGAICTCGALLVAKEFGGKVMGYFNRDNPTATIGDEGHDFAVVDGWIVDFWAWAYESEIDYPMMRVDSDEAKKCYGDPEKWVLFGAQEKG